MKTIEIDTAQKVRIQYEIASLGTRFSAALLDLLIMTGTFIFVMLFSFFFLLDVFRSSESEVLYTIVITPFFIFYTFLSEVLMNGQTLGKRMMGIKVVKLNGEAPTAQDFFIRWVFRGLDIWLSLAAVGSLLISSSTMGQRMGGLLSNTAVIRLANQTRVFNLTDILKISSIDSYTPTYMEVVNFSEEDMLFVKKVLERLQRYPNDAHRKVVRELSAHFAKMLELASKPKDEVAFLRTLINDYVVLTR